jgi:hypothetical protein
VSTAENSSGRGLDFAATNLSHSVMGSRDDRNACLRWGLYVEDAVAFHIDALIADLSKLDDDVIDEDGII